MTLPKIYTPTETVDVAGQLFEVRVVTRAEQFRFQQLLEADAPKDELEITVISVATDTPTEEAREWYGQTPGWAVQELLEAITRISRLDDPGAAQKSG